MIFPIILGLVALGGVLIVMKKKAPPTPGIPPIPPPVVVRFDVEELVQEIRQSGSLPELDAYYRKIGELFINMEISHVEYLALYNAYYERWMELVGES